AVGVTMRLFTPGPGEASERARQCCGPTAFDDARKAATAAGMPHYVLNFEAAFQRAVIDYFCDEYLAGRTPNPCIACNNVVKFGVLLDFARVLGAQTLITGHYARIVRDEEGGVHLLRAIDRTKDQSYMLAGLRTEQLAAVVTPLGEMTKEQTRELARVWLPALADKPDSMDLCFIDGDYRDFIAQRFPEHSRRGPLITVDGRTVGEHDGLLGYTVGQRKGIAASELGDGPWYVVRTDRESNAVVIGRREDLARTRVRCSRANVLRPDSFDDCGFARGRAVCRYRAASVGARAMLDGDALSVEFEEPVAVVSPGQLFVLYDEAGEEVVASGIIEG
ncbi:MAG TPA: tRNA 2-thiouridine(34) synthase MnmA, partial [Candidatus Eremiobacteraceae bacterium]|nr:tRNA 2-thiouridine(34) synthase MnmA [Candidatus Eremiobacteraceae bacterium]